MSEDNILGRPPVRMICYNDANGNPHTFSVGLNCTRIVETQEKGELDFIPWVEVWDSDKLIARFNQHKLEHIFY